MKSSSKIWLEAAAYDPSCRRADTRSYWQWSNVPLGAHWDRVAECVNKGWPSMCQFTGSGARWYGVLATGGGEFWIYRIYAGGRDSFGREGRYFFVSVLLQSKKDLLNPKVAGLFRYFDTERGLPLNTDPLNEGWVDAEPDEILRIISKKLDSQRSLSHWGIADGGHITVFSKISPLPQVSPAVKPEHPANGRNVQITDPLSVLGLLPYLSAFFRRRRGSAGRIMKFVKICTGIALFFLLVLLGIEGWRKWRKIDPPEEPDPPVIEIDKPKEPKVTDPEKDKPNQDPQGSRPDAPEDPPTGGAKPPPTPKTLPSQSEGLSEPSKTPETQTES